jgi:hypothetical protein
MTIRKDFTWTMFWRWLVLWDWADVIMWNWKIIRTLECECECWTRKTVRHYNLVNWKSISCWCYHNEVRRELIKEIHKTQKWEWNPNWKWWITKESVKRQNKLRWHNQKLWSVSIIERDWSCMKCWGNKNLQAHHINSFISNPEIRFNLDNWICLCQKCHTKFHKKFWYKNNTQEQIDEYLI